MSGSTQKNMFELSTIELNVNLRCGHAEKTNRNIMRIIIFTDNRQINFGTSMKSFIFLFPHLVCSKDHDI